ncbi:MAG: iron complex outerrane recepter protein [Pseudomonadota bacterium]|nr:iron complex outerrane recepter protein [Pseudomonadota bacterium]
MRASTTIFTGKRPFRAGRVAGWLTCTCVAGAWSPLALPADAADSDDAGLVEVTVTGTRIRQDGITAPTPVTVVGAERLQDLGATNLGNVLNALPSFRPSSNPQTTNITPRAAGMIQADLRGLTPVRTLVLVNDRRFIPSTQEGTIDLNQIPTLLLDRTEVVTGGASAQYGSDAVAGVVNIFTKRKMEGMTAELQYGITEEGDAKNLRAGLAGGLAFAGGRGHVVGAIEMEDNQGVGNCYTRDWCAQEWQVIANGGSANPNAAGHKLIGYPANNILSASRTVNAVQGGLILSGPLRGTAFNDNGTPRAFQYGLVFPNNPTFMQGGDGAGRNGFIGAPLMMIPTERYVGFGSLQYEFTDTLQGFAELSYGHTASHGRGAQTRDFFPGGGNAITIRGDNPFLSADLRTSLQNAGLPLTSATSFVLGRMGDDFGYTDNRNQSDVMRVLVGLSGSLGAGWNWDVSVQYGRTQYDQEVGNNRVQQQVLGVTNVTGQPTRIQLAADATIDTNGQPICRSTLTNPGNGCVPVNLFGVNNWSAAARDYLYADGWLKQEFTQKALAANLQGDLFSTWAGPVPLAVGVEYRDNDSSTTADPISASSGFYVFNSSVVSGGIEVTEGYAETVVPLAADLPFAKSLSVNGAFRYANYSTSGDVKTWKYGAVYEPVDWLKFRGTRSRDIRAPNAAELYSPQVSGFQTINGILVPTVSGGNPDLQPEVADTATYGVSILGSGALQGLRASVDYYDIDIQDVIATLAGQVLLNRCLQVGAYCDQIVFNPGTTTPAQVSVVSLNLNRLQTSGIDFEVGYRLPLTVFSAAGVLDLRLLATRVIHLKTTDATGASIERAGVNGNNVSGGGAGLPHWQLNGLVNYQQGGLSLSLETRYIQSGLFDSTLIGPEQAGYNVDLPNSINTNHVAGALYFNLGARYRFAGIADGKLEVFGAIQNLLDKDPPVAPSNQGATNQLLYDPLGRLFRLGMRLDF